MNFFNLGGFGGGGRISSPELQKKEGVPEMGTKPLKALRGYRSFNRGSKGQVSRLKGV